MRVIMALLMLSVIVGCSSLPRHAAESKDAESAASEKTGGIRTPQDAVDALFRSQAPVPWTELDAFGRTIGTRQGVLHLGGPGPESSGITASFETASRVNPDGTFDVTLTRRWNDNGKEFVTEWSFTVTPQGEVKNAAKTGDELPIIK